MRKFLAKHAAATTGTLSSFDRLLFKGHLPLGYPHRDGGVPHAPRRPVQDLKAFVLQQADRLKAHAHAMAERAGRPYEYFESPGCLCRAGLAKAVTTALRCVFEPMARLRRPPRTRFSW
jgi:hypothetical protein